MKTFYTFILLALLLAIDVQAGTLSATTDRTQLGLNETLTLTIQYDASTDDEPDTRELEQQFTILGRTNSSNLQIFNGNISKTTTWNFELSPRQSGTLLIPPFKLNNDVSEPISIDVGANSNNAANGNQQNIYTETSLDKDKVFVQQQVIVTWRLISRFPISQPQFFPPQIDGVLVQDLGIRAYKRSDAERVVEQSYALFPQKSGNIIIPPQQFQVIVDAPQRNSAGFFRPSRSQMQLSTDEKSITVVPAESSTNNPQNTHWLPASSLEISQEILGADSAHPATAGTAFTRIIRMRAEGLSAEQLPPPNMQAPGIKVYNETPVLNNKDNQQGVVGMREDRAAVIAAQPGKLLLPAITIPWYDVDAVQWRETVLPATEIDVLPGTTINSSTSTNTADTKTSAPTQDKLAQINPTQDHPAATPVVNQTPSTTNESYLWQISTAVLFTLLLAIIIYLYKQQHRGKQPISDRTTIVDTPVRPSHNTALRHATEQGDLKKIHQTLQAWAKEQEVNRLALQHPSVTPLLQALEKHLYGNGIAPDAQTLKNLPSQLEELAAGQPPQNNQTSQLETLYR